MTRSRTATSFTAPVAIRSTEQPSLDSRHQAPTVIPSARYDGDDLTSGCRQSGKEPLIRMLGAADPNPISIIFPSPGNRFVPYQMVP